ncbi:hypothetical protein [Austwickia chelonae]|uniref:hypothetical protein n=1 Tax=Austwickia chelonae TaxID=100225 RepID=UPI00138B1166|nr:hypothetical protein [Austwickia chelonae]
MKNVRTPTITTGLMEVSVRHVASDRTQEASLSRNGEEFAHHVQDSAGEEIRRFGLRTGIADRAALHRDFLGRFRIVGATARLLDDSTYFDAVSILPFATKGN